MPNWLAAALQDAGFWLAAVVAPTVIISGVLVWVALELRRLRKKLQ